MVELARMGLDELGRRLANHSLLMSVRDGLRERVKVQGRDLLHNRREQQPRGKARVLRLFCNQRSCRVDRDGVKLPRGRAIVKTPDGLGRDTDSIDMVKAVGRPLNGANDLVHVNGLKRTVAFANVK